MLLEFTTLDIEVDEFTKYEVVEVLMMVTPEGAKVGLTGGETGMGTVRV